MLFYVLFCVDNVLFYVLFCVDNVLFYVLFCVDNVYYCHRESTQLQLNMSYHIKTGYSIVHTVVMTGTYSSTRHVVMSCSSPPPNPYYPATYALPESEQTRLYSA